MLETLAVGVYPPKIVCFLPACTLPEGGDFLVVNLGCITVASMHGNSVTMSISPPRAKVFSA